MTTISCTMFCLGVLPWDPNPTWFGYFKGRWEGDTLVVDTRGFNDRSWLGARQVFCVNGRSFSNLASLVDWTDLSVG